VATLHVLRVFADPEGEYGNALGVFLEGSEVAANRRQGIARDLGFAETVFIDDRPRGGIRIFTPEVELPFAGHPTVGAAWLLRREGESAEALIAPAGELAVRYEPDRTWIAARPEWSPPFEYPQLEDPGAVDALTDAPGGAGWSYPWAWQDEEAGLIRARSFVAEAGIAEDEATGSAALALCGRLGRELKIVQGRGSVIHGRPAADGFVEVGGRVVLDEVRDYSG